MVSEVLDGICNEILPMFKGDTKDDYFDAYIKRKKMCRYIHKYVQGTEFLGNIFDDRYVNIVNASVQAKNSGDHSIFVMQVQNVDANKDRFWDFLEGPEDIQ